MNTHKGTNPYKQAFLVFVFTAWALLWQQSAFAANDPDVTGDGRVNTLDVSTVASCIGRDIALVTRCACADTNGDRVIDKTDYGFVASKVGTSGYPLEPNACLAIIKPNTPPNANAGPDQTVTTGRTVALSASGSSDADGNALTFQWSFVSKPPGSTATLSNPNTVTPGFVIDRPGNYVVQVSVSDGKASSTDTVTISTINSPPVANAGVDQGIFIGDTVTLNGAASSDVDGDTLSFRWSFTASIPAGSTATLTGATTVNPTFVADTSGSYQVQLIVNDGTADSAPSTVTISTRNTPPVANAGADQGVTRGATVQLNGVASSDIDGNLLTFAWSLTRPAGSTATLSTATAVNPTFVADVTGSYVAQLIVNDGFVNSVADTVMITVTPGNVAPTANAGADQSAALGGMVQLNGAASSDPEGAPLGYSWSFTSRPAGSTVPLSAINIFNPVFVVDRVGTYIAQLIVNDGVLSSLPDTMIVTTFNPVPVANAGADQTVSVGATVTLDGRASTDANGDALVYSWSFTSVPSGSTATLSQSGTSRPTFTATHAGNYVVQLIVSDGATNSPPDTVMITVTPAPNRAPTANAGLDRTGNVGTTVTLDGSVSSDLDSDTLTYQWSFVSRPAGSSAALTNPTAVNPAFTPDVAGAYTVQLIVNDSTVNSAADTVTITVAASPLLPVVSITAPDAAASEVGLDPGKFTFTRSGGVLSQALQVNFTLSGSASNGSDYATTSNFIILPANQASATVTIIPLGDNLVEGNETMVFTVTANAAYTIGTPASATVTIADTVVVATYTLGGTISGLTGTLVLQNNGGNDLSRSANGNFTFVTALDNSAAYNVTVFTPPTGQTCVISNGSGTLSGANVTNVMVTCVTTLPPSVVIDSPASGAISQSNRILVSGTFRGSANTGITVNGVVASIEGSHFYANHVPLVPGVNTLTATLVTQEGATATHRISLTREGSIPITVSVDPEGGIAPLKVAFTLTNNTGQPTQAISADFDGDGVTDFTTSDPSAPIEYTYTTPAVYQANIIVTDNLGQPYTSKHVIVVNSVASRDTLLRGVYNNLLASLRSGNIEAALQSVTGGVYEKYKRVFTALKPDLPNVVNNLGTLEDGAISNEMAEYVIVRNTADGPQAFLIYFIRSEDGVWRIDGM